MTATTGRSSEPVPFLYTQHDLDNLLLSGRALMEIAGSLKDDRMINMFPFSPHLAFWQAHYASLAQGVFCIGTGGGKVSGTEGNLRTLRKVQPQVLIGMPTFIYHVMHAAVEEGVSDPNLRKLVLGGEKVPAGMRRKLRHLAEQIGAKDVDVISTYGFTEAKMAWPECPTPPGERSTGFHIPSNLALIEIVDPETGKQQPFGSPGEIVFTPLDARGSVVLRYRTGDIIDGGLDYAPCPACGRLDPRLVGNISRRSEFRELSIGKLKGTLVDFNELEHVLDDAPGVGAWQIEIRKRNDDPLELDELVLHVNATNGSGTSFQDKLSDLFAERVEVRPNRIQLHTADAMRRLQGVGTQLKELKIVDHRPGENDSADSSQTPARTNANRGALKS
jgi:phenylacetate-coenzyme A ligase PaaK-like adenylate-forming protein